MRRACSAAGVAALAGLAACAGEPTSPGPRPTPAPSPSVADDEIAGPPAPDPEAAPAPPGEGEWSDPTEGATATLVYVAEMEGPGGVEPGAVIFSSDPESAHFHRVQTPRVFVRRLTRAAMTELLAELEDAGLGELPWGPAEEGAALDPDVAFHLHQHGRRTVVGRADLEPTERRRFAEIEERLVLEAMGIDDETAGPEATLVYVTEVRLDGEDTPGAVIVSSDPGNDHYHRRPSRRISRVRLSRAEMAELLEELEGLGLDRLPWAEQPYDAELGPERALYRYRDGVRRRVAKAGLPPAAFKAFAKVERHVLDFVRQPR